MAEFRMPSLGADMEEGTLVEWLVHPGDTVRKGDVVAVVDTAKAAIEVETFATGVIDDILVQPGQRVPVGTVLATITETEPAAVPEPVVPELVVSAPVGPVAVPELAGPLGESPVTSPLIRRFAAAHHVDLHALRGTGPGGRVTHADVQRAAAAGAGAGQSPPLDGARRLRVSPLARRLAAELGVDLTAVSGTGSGGAIGADDIRRNAHKPAREAAPTVPVEVGSPDGAGGASQARPQLADRSAAMRATIAALMARSKREIPHYYLADTIDLGAAMDWLRERNRQLPVPQRLVPAALLLKAAALALRKVPQLNGFWIDDHFVPGGGIHLGVAVSLRGGGLVAPAIHDADTLDLATLMARMRDLVTRTRAGRLKRAELSDPTITVSNMGEQGAESIFGVIYPPQVALVGFGRIVERPWAIDGLIGPRPIVTVSLAADHRATDGATGARYLQTITRLLHKPEEL